MLDASTNNTFVSTVRLCAPRFTSEVAPVYGTNVEVTHDVDAKVDEA